MTTILEQNVTIEKGLNELFEKRLSEIESKINSGKEISKETVNYFDIYRVAVSENMDVAKYDEKYHSLINKFWDCKKRK